MYSLDKLFIYNIMKMYTYGNYINVTIAQIYECIGKRRLDQIIVKWIAKFLSNRHENRDTMGALINLFFLSSLKNNKATKLFLFVEKLIIIKACIRTDLQRTKMLKHVYTHKNRIQFACKMITTLNNKWGQCDIINIYNKRGRDKIHPFITT